MSPQNKVPMPEVRLIEDHQRRLEQLTVTSRELARQCLVDLSWSLAELRGKFWNLDTLDTKYYTYVYLDPRKPGVWEYKLPSGKQVRFKFKPFYVGKGQGARIDAHSRRSSIEKASHKSNTIKAIRAAGLKEVVYKSKDVSEVSDWLAKAYEIDLIAGIGRMDLGTGPLTNMTSGGEGMSGSVVSLSTRKKHTDQLRNRWSTKTEDERKLHAQKMVEGRQKARAQMTDLQKAEYSEKLSAAHLGKRHSEETKIKLSKLRKGVKQGPRSEAHNEIMRRVLLGRKHSAETKAKMSSSHKGKPSKLKGRMWSPARRAAQEARVKK